MNRPIVAYSRRCNTIIQCPQNSGLVHETTGTLQDRYNRLMVHPTPSLCSSFQPVWTSGYMDTTDKRRKPFFSLLSMVQVTIDCINYNIWWYSNHLPYSSSQNVPMFSQRPSDPQPPLAYSRVPSLLPLLPSCREPSRR